jgi:signal transduction histidine kinase
MRMLQRIPRSLASFCCYATMIFGIAVLVGWQARIPFLRGEASGTFVAPNAAASFILTAIATLCASGSKRLQWVARLLAGLVFVWATLTLFEHITNRNLGIDALLMRDHLQPWKISSPVGRYAWPTAISFLLLSASLLLRRVRRLSSEVAEVVAGFGVLCALLSLLGRLYSAKQLYGYWMAPLTAIVFLVLGLGMVLGPARGRFMTVLLARGSGGMLARRFLGITLLIVPLLGWLRLQLYWHGVWDFEFGTALLVVAFIILFVIAVFFTALTLDDSERKREHALKALIDSEKLATTGRFATQIAHEINNPLEAVSNLLFLMRTAEGRRREEFLTIAEQELDRVAHITKQTLGFYRGSGVPTAVDVHATVEDIALLLKPKLRSHRTAIVNQVAPDVKVLVEPGEFRQVLSNLIANAIDASPEDSKVVIGSNRARAYVEVSVSDEGCGISQAILPKIFEPFFTTKMSGTGLGLWVCKDLVTKNNGTLAVSTSIAGRRGTSFTIALPAAEDESASSERSARSSAAR